MLDNNPATTAIAAGNQLAQLHNDGSIWRSTGAPGGWQMLDNNPPATAIAAAGDQLYQLHNDGSIWQSTGVGCSGGSCPGWQMLDNNPSTTAIVAADNGLYQLHSDGSIWRFSGEPCSGGSCPGWQMLDNNPAATAIAAGTDAVPAPFASPIVYQLHNDGSIWRSTGAPCSGSSCGGWEWLDNNLNTGMIAANAGGLYQEHSALVYQLHFDGSLWRHTGPGGGCCTGWEMLDDNPAAKSIIASRVD
jgi:hypothetical protein